MSIGFIMFGKAIVLAIWVALGERYAAWKVNRRRNGINLSFDGRGYYDPIIRWEARAHKAWIIMLWCLPIISAAFVALLFIPQ